MCIWAVVVVWCSCSCRCCCCCLSIYRSIYLSIHLSICLSASLKTKQFCETSSNFELDNVKTKKLRKTSSVFELDNIKNEGIVRDFLNFRSWQHHKRNNCARLLQKWKVECRADGLVPMRFAIFPLHLSKAPPATKKWCQVIRSAAPVTQNHLPTTEDLMLQNATPGKCILQILFKCPTPAIVFDKTLTFLRLPGKTTSETSKVVRACGVFTSSTAQGGGGSFKNRKPCCEARMAERIHWWTDRWLELCFWSGCNGCSGHLFLNCLM